MSNIFETLIKKRKNSFIAGFLFVLAIGAAVKIIRPKENAANFIIFYIAIPLFFSLSYLLIEKIIKRNKPSE